MKTVLVQLFTQNQVPLAQIDLSDKPLGRCNEVDSTNLTSKRILTCLTAKKYLVIISRWNKLNQLDTFSNINICIISAVSHMKFGRMQRMVLIFSLNSASSGTFPRS